MNLQYFIKNNKKGLHSSELLLGKSSTTGFTTIELIIAISIIVILTAIALPKLNNFKTTQTHKNEVGNVMALLNEARVRALSGDNARDYNILFNPGNNTVTLSRITTDEGDTEYEETITLDSHVGFTTTLTDNTVSFTRFTGASSSIGTITITTTSGAYTKTSVIRMYTSGLAALD